MIPGRVAVEPNNIVLAPGSSVVCIDLSLCVLCVKAKLLEGLSTFVLN